MSDGVSFFCSLLFASPFLAIVAILVYDQFRRNAWRGKKQKGMRILGFCPSSVALGASLLFLSVFYPPRLKIAIEASLDEDVEEDDNGEPETPEGLLAPNSGGFDEAKEWKGSSGGYKPGFPPFPQKETERMGHGASRPRTLPEPVCGTMEIRLI